MERSADPIGPNRLIHGMSANAPLAALVVFLVFAVRAGLGVGDAVVAVVSITLTQVLPGAMVWRLVRSRDGSWVEDVVVGFAIGVAIAVAAQTVAGVLSIPAVAAVPGPLLVAVLLLMPGPRHRIRTAAARPLPMLWGPTVAGVSLLLLESAQVFYRTVPYQWGGFRTTYVDMPFHLALVGQVAERGPTSMPHVAGEPLLYHWFSHAWLAQIVNASGVPADAVLYRLLPPVISVALVCSVAVVAVRVSGRPWAGPLAALFAVAAGDLDVLNGISGGFLVHHLSPSHGVGLFVSLALVGVLAVRWRSEARPGAAWLVFVLAFVAAGSKGSSLPVVLVGIALALGGALVHGRRHTRVIGTDLALATAALALGFVVVFGGAASGLALDPLRALTTAGPTAALVDTPSGSVVRLGAAALVLTVALSARGVGMLGLLSDKHTRQDPVLLLLLGTGLAGVGAMLLLTHPGRSQVYFLRSAAPFFALGSAWGLTVLAERVSRPVLVAAIGWVAGVGSWWLLGPSGLVTGWTAPLGGILIGLLALGAVCVVAARATRMAGGRRRDRALAVVAVSVLTLLVVPVARSQLTPSLPPNTPEVAPGAPTSFSGDQRSAARWLRDHSDPGDLVMTNRHCQAARQGHCDPRRFHVAAYTQRAILVEGWGYTPTWWASDRPRSDRPFWNEELLALNDRFLQDPTEVDARRLRELGVEWIYVDKTTDYSRALSDVAVSRHETRWAWVLELTE